MAGFGERGEAVLRPIFLVLLALAPPCHAAVPPAAAQQLGANLTPVGAERAGNQDGTIPAWDGKAAAPATSETPLLVITQANAPTYHTNLPEGALALFRKFPDFRMKIYPTYRTATAPDWVYRNIFRNATQAQAAPEGIAYGVTGTAGGVPFPIPQNATEIVWNHLLAFWGTAREAHIATYVAAGDGSIIRTAAYHEVTDFPYYDPKATPDTVGPYYYKTRRIQDAPASRAGEAYIAWQPLDTARDPYVAWRYLPGEHRTRKAPSLSYDTPNADASGYEALDEYYLFFGGPDRYDFRILGKREMFIPYNNNSLLLHPATDALTPTHENPDALRYERHRVWVVEGVLAPGKHHVAPRRRLYIDEDTWMAVYSDSWDEDGKLWKFGHATMPYLSGAPAVVVGSQFIYDLLQGGYCYDFAFGAADMKITPLHLPSTFDAQVMAAESLK
jgi:hypothetical protein